MRGSVDQGGETVDRAHAAGCARGARGARGGAGCRRRCCSTSRVPRRRQAAGDRLRGVGDGPAGHRAEPREQEPARTPGALVSEPQRAEDGAAWDEADPEARQGQAVGGRHQRDGSRACQAGPLPAAGVHRAKVQGARPSPGRPARPRSRGGSDGGPAGQRHAGDSPLASRRRAKQRRRSGASVDRRARAPGRRPHHAAQARPRDPRAPRGPLVGRPHDGRDPVRSQAGVVPHHRLRRRRVEDPRGQGDQQLWHRAPADGYGKPERRRIRWPRRPGPGAPQPRPGSAAGRRTAGPTPIPVGDPLQPPPNPRATSTDFADSTAFLYEGPDAPQQGVAAGAIDVRRVAVLRGRVVDTAGAPLGGARIDVLNRTDLGHVLTRADGGYDIAVNGGGLLTLRITRPGSLSVQRQEPAPWQDFVTLEDIVAQPARRGVDRDRPERRRLAVAQIVAARRIPTASDRRRSSSSPARKPR